MKLTPAQERVLLTLAADSNTGHVHGHDCAAGRSLLKLQLVKPRRRDSIDVYDLTPAGEREVTKLRCNLADLKRIARSKATSIVYNHLFREADAHPAFYCNGATCRPSNWTPDMTERGVVELVDCIATAILKGST